MGFWMALVGGVTASETLEEPDKPSLSVTVAVNVRLPAPALAFTVTVFVHTFGVVPSNTIVTDESAPMAPASNVTPVTAPSPLVVVTLTNVLCLHVNDVGEAVVTEVGGTWTL